MMPKSKLLLASMTLLMAYSVTAQEPSPQLLRQQVENTERAFAATMAERDYAAFTRFLSDEAVFFSGETVLHGKQEVAAAWKPYFDGAEAPFAWEPQVVEVLDSGALALSSGPVYDPGGKLVSHFTSIWRLEAPGTWRIIFDKGSRACSAPVPEEKDQDETDREE
jgi:ketosteroid isomerase-like protein